MKNNDILKGASHAVNSDRQGEYGDPVENAVKQAIIVCAMTGLPLSPLDCNSVNFAQKIVRMGIHSKEDTLVDVAGYTEIRARIIEAFQAGTVQDIVEEILGSWVYFGPTRLIPPTGDGE